MFYRRTLTGSKTFCRLTCLDAITFVLPCFFTLIRTICPKILVKTLTKNEKNSLSVDLRRLKTSLPKLPIGNWGAGGGGGGGMGRSILAFIQL